VILFSRTLAILLLSTGAFAQVTPTAVTDAASFTNRVAPGSLASIFGQNIATKNMNAASIPLPFSLGGVQVTVDGIRAPLVYIGVTPFNQVNFQMPREVLPGTANLVITVNGVGSAPFPVDVTPSAPGIFTYDPTGGTFDPTLLQAVIQNPPDYNNSNINSPSNPAPAGAVVVAYMDGTGAVQFPVRDGDAATGTDPAVNDSSATVGGEAAEVQYLGLTPGSVALGQANIRIPPDLPSGDYPLVINVGGLQSISATVSVSGGGTLPTFLNEVAVFNNFAVSQRTTIQLFNNTLYLCGDALIRVFDITTPSDPTFIGAYGEQALQGRQISCSVNPTAARPYLVSVVGPETQPTLVVFDLSENPQAPTVIAQDVFVNELVFTHVQRFVFDDAIGLANASWIDSNGKHGNILAVDFTDPANPLLISVLSSPKLNPFIFFQACLVLPHAIFGEWDLPRKLHRRCWCNRRVRYQ
jgi:uncharacterized protein (TIGR03437 family)